MDKEKIETLLEKREGNPGELIEVLQDIQEMFNELPKEALEIVSERLCVPLIEVFRVANFYKAFRLSPRGKHLLTICVGTACHGKGAPKLLDEVLGHLNISPGETTGDGLFTVLALNCIGACALAPVVVMDGRIHDRMTPVKLRRLIDLIKKESMKVEVL